MLVSQVLNDAGDVSVVAPARAGTGGAVKVKVL